MEQITNASAQTMLVEMAQGYFRGKVLCAAVRLGIADALGDDEKDLEGIAAAIAAEPDALYRLLRALASIGIVREAAPNRFSLTPFGQLLRRDKPDSVWASIVFWADLIADSWTYLAECVKAGGNSNAFAAMEREGVKSRWSRVPDANAIFHAVFAEPGAESMAPLAAAYDFSGYGVVADLGGAGGGLLAAVLNANPHMRGVLVEREGAIAGATQKLNSAGLLGRCEFLVCDLLESVPRGAGVYVMQRVLHGYDNGRAARILRNCREVMSPEKRLLIIEAVIPAHIDCADPAVEKVLMADLNMLTVTGGRERSEAEWASLLASANFELRRAISIPSATACIIEAVPVE